VIGVTDDTLQHASVFDHVDGRTSSTSPEDVISTFHMLDAYLVTEPFAFYSFGGRPSRVDGQSVAIATVSAWRSMQVIYPDNAYVGASKKDNYSSSCPAPRTVQDDS
jgi:hypothetical protein